MIQWYTNNRNMSPKSQDCMFYGVRELKGTTQGRM